MSDTIESRLRLLAQAAETLHVQSDPANLVRTIVDLSRQLLSADAYAVWRLEESGWQVVAEYALPAGYSRSTPPTQDSIPHDPVMVEDVLTDPWLKTRHQSYREARIRSLLCLPLKIDNRISGTIAFYYREPHARDEMEIRIAAALASLAGSILTTAELYKEQARMRAAAEQAQARLAFLAESSSVLASSLDYAETLEKIAGLAVPTLADWCAIHILEEDGTVHPVPVAHSDPHKAQLGREMQERYPYDPLQESGIPEVLRTGKPLVMAEITDAMLVAGARNAEHLEALRQLGMRSVMIVPLQARSRVLGALTLVAAESEVRYDASMLPLVEGLASRAALAIDNARLYRESARALEARMASEAALRASEEQFRNLVEQSPLSIQILAPDGRTLEVNHAWEQLWGATLADLSEYNMLADSQLEQLGIMPYIRRAFAGEVVSVPPVAYDTSQALPVVAGEGSRRWVRAYAYPVRDGEGHIRKVVLVHEDFTDRQRLEDELRDRITELGIAARQKDEFLAMLAHELRNPLAPIMNAAHVLRISEFGSEFQAQSLQIIEHQVRHMSRLLDDLLDVSRITRGVALLKRERIDLRTPIRAAAEASAAFLKQRGCDFEIDLPATPLVAEVDPARIEQIVMNLLNNAGRYSLPGGRVQLALGHESMRSEGAAGPQAIAPNLGACGVLRIADTGIGMAPELLPRIFDLFVQGEPPSDLRSGLGIGLTLVRDLVRLHGGSIEAHSEGRGRGSEFIVRLPLAPTPGASADQNGSGRQAQAEPVAGRRILVVDDNVDAAETLRHLLMFSGYEVQVAHSGDQALALHATFEPNVVLLDLGLPGMSGYEVAERIRGQITAGEGRRKRSVPPLIAITGFGSAEEQGRTRRAGFYHHLTKPVEPDLLLEILASMETRGEPAS